MPLDLEAGEAKFQIMVDLLCEVLVWEYAHVWSKKMVNLIKRHQVIMVLGLGFLGLE